MLQDVEAGLPTEVDVFGGKMIKLGKSLNIATPVNQTIVQIIKVIEHRIRSGCVFFQPSSERINIRVSSVRAWLLKKDKRPLVCLGHLMDGSRLLGIIALYTGKVIGK